MRMRIEAIAGWAAVIGSITTLAGRMTSSQTHPCTRRSRPVMTTHDMVRVVKEACGAQAIAAPLRKITAWTACMIWAGVRGSGP